MDWKARPAIALLLVALVSLGAFQFLLPHTDDGCPTEIHCQACRLGLGNLAVVESLPQAAPRPVALRCERTPDESTRELLRASALLLRGPPPA